MGTNPAVSMPDAGRVRAALKACDFVVVSDVTRTDTTRYADVLLPAAAWGEKDGTVTNSERRISRQRPFLPPPARRGRTGGSSATWRSRMGFADAFAYAVAARRSSASTPLSRPSRTKASACSTSARWPISTARPTRNFAPRQWPACRARTPAPIACSADGRFPTPDGRARFVAVRQEGPALAVDRELSASRSTPGRLRDQWHTMTRTGRVPRLMAHAPEPVLDLHPVDAHGPQARRTATSLISRPATASRGRRSASPTRQRPGQAFLPMHWSGLFAANAGPRISLRSDRRSASPASPS